MSNDKYDSVRPKFKKLKKKDYSERVNYVNPYFSVERDLNMKAGLSLKQVFYAFYTEELN